MFKRWRTYTVAPPHLHNPIASRCNLNSLHAKEATVRMTPSVLVISQRCASQNHACETVSAGMSFPVHSSFTDLQASLFCTRCSSASVVLILLFPYLRDILLAPSLLNILQMPLEHQSSPSSLSPFSSLTNLHCGPMHHPSTILLSLGLSMTDVIQVICVLHIVDLYIYIYIFI